MIRAWAILVAGLVVASSAMAQPTAGFSRPTTVAFCPCAHNGQAPDWRQDPVFKGSYSFEQFSAPPGSFSFDGSLEENHLTRGGVGITSRADRVRSGCWATQVNGPTDTWLCTAPECLESDFCPVNSPFTAGCWLRPDDVVHKRSVWTTDDFFGTFGAGYRIGWEQTGLGSGTYFFNIDPTGGSGDTQLNTFTSYAPLVARNHVARFFFRPGELSGTMEQFVNGTQDASTLSSSPVDECDRMQLGGGAFNTSLTGAWDDCYYANAALSDESICKIAVCGLDGCGCSCDWGGMAQNYTRAPLHTSFGGPITCTLPSCDGTTSVTILPTTTSTSVTSTTSTIGTSTTSTSVTTSTSSSTSSTTSTSVTTTSVTTSTSSSTSSTTSTSVTTSTSSTSSSTSSTTSTSSSTSSSTTTTVAFAAEDHFERTGLGVDWDEFDTLSAASCVNPDDHSIATDGATGTAGALCSWETGVPDASDAWACARIREFALLPDETYVGACLAMNGAEDYAICCSINVGDGFSRGEYATFPPETPVSTWNQAWSPGDYVAITRVAEDLFQCASSSDGINWVFQNSPEIDTSSPGGRTGVIVAGGINKIEQWASGDGTLPVTACAGSEDSVPTTTTSTSSTTSTTL